MKIAMVTALMVVVGAAFYAAAGQAAGVSDYGAMVRLHSPSCVLGVPRIDHTAASAQACCDGVTCSQMLATTKIDRPRASSHT